MMHIIKVKDIGTMSNLNKIRTYITNKVDRNGNRFYMGAKVKNHSGHGYFENYGICIVDKLFVRGLLQIDYDFLKHLEILES